jgi:hypothetical protein
VANGRAVRRGRWILWLAGLSASVLATAARPVAAQDAETHRGTMALSYQYNEAQNLLGGDVTIPTGVLTTRLIDFSFDYALNDRWSVSAGLPLISRKAFDPNRGHDPLRIIPPHTESEFIDDGEFHTYWQDLRLGARYLAITEPFIVEPYVEYSIPASAYPFFANAAVGQHLRKFEYGTTLAYRPPFLQWFFSWRMGYVDAPATLGVSIDGVRIDAEAVRFLSPRVSMSVFFSSKHSKGNALHPGPPPPPGVFTTEAWYQHDRMIRHNYISTGIGTTVALGDRNVLSIDWLRMARAQDVFKLKNALNFSVSRSFGPPAPSKHAGGRQLPTTPD